MLLLIDKPKGITSHDVVDAVRRKTGERRVGHAGTLDPNATGLLIVAVGREDTKKLGALTTGTAKTYLATIVLGEARDTDDIEGQIIKKDEGLPEFKQTEIEMVLNGFVGEQTQVPPIYSAIKMNGKKAYELARAGKAPEMEPRVITVHSVRLLEYFFPTIIVEFEVSSGTYIRSLARDIGLRLGTVAYLRDLRRTRIGEYDVDNATALEALTV